VFPPAIRDDPRFRASFVSACDRLAEVAPLAAMGA